MKDELMKLLMKKKREGKELSPDDKAAKMGVIKNLKKIANEAMTDDLSGLRKVTVAAPDSESLKEGLEMAEEVVELDPEMEAAEETSEETGDFGREVIDESTMMEDSEMMEEPEMTEEELDAKIAELMSKKERMKI